MTTTRNTINHLRLCQTARAQGHPVSYTTDPAWLVNQAINRRAGWLDDPSHTRGSAMPVKRNPNKSINWTRYARFHRWQATEYPAKASGARFSELLTLARRLNTRRLVVREQELGSWRKLILSRVSPDRITRNGEE